MPRQNVVVDPAFPRRLRELREDAGLSLRALATRALSSKSHLADFEAGRKVPSVEAVRRIDQALSAGGELARMVSPAPHWKDPELRRRTVVSLAAGLTAGLVTGVSPDPYVGSGQRLITQAQIRTARLRRLDDHLGGADTYSLYLAEMEATGVRAREGGESESTTRGLLAVMAEQAQMAGFSAFDAGWHAEAERLFRLSLSAAEDADDAATAANALTFLGYQSLALCGRGADYSTAACDMAANCTPRVRALLLERRAWAHAVERDLDQAERCLDAAASALREYDDRPDPDWTAWVDETEITIMTGRCWTVLHRPLRAITALEDALRRYDDTHGRDKALYLTFLAQAYLDSNEVERACDIAETAMDLAAGVGSARPRDRMEALVRQMEPHRTVPRVAELIGLATDWIRSRSLPAPTPGTALELPQSPPL
jgi:transcriptional regulator with XRE-family HTH domain